MSRTRIVMGNYTKITGGNHNMYSEKSIVTEAHGNIVENGKENGVIHGTPERPPEEKDSDFDIKFSLNRESKHTTVVPFGILDFSGKDENAFFIFNYSLHIGNVDSLSFKIYDQDNVEVYGIINLPEIVVTASKYPLLLQKKEEAKPKANDGFNSNIWHWKPLYEQYTNAASDYTKIGSYLIFWDGFDNNNIYDSARFNNKKFTAVLTGKKGGKVLTRKVEFSTEYNQVDWVDVKIDKNTKKIDATLRVNLKDGGEEGLSCKYYSVGEEAVKQITVCDWDKISNEAITYFRKPPIIKRTKSYSELEKLALEGIEYFWSRNSKNIGKGVNIDKTLFQTFITAVQNENGMKAPKIIYFTNSKNTDFNRSHNHELHRALYYKTGYTFYSDWQSYDKNKIVYVTKGWIYHENIDLRFKETSAHEIGHQLLFEYGGRSHSYLHKGTSGPTWIQQDPLPGTKYPKGNTEIDLMKYAEENEPSDYFDKVILSQEDMLGLIWLTKIKVKW